MDPVRRAGGWERDRVVNPLVKKVDVARVVAAARGTTLQRQVPSLSRREAVAELSRVPGLGAARAGRLYDELGICTLTELHHALEEGRMADVRGIGTGIEARLKDALDRLLDDSAHLSIAEAEFHVNRLLAHMRQAPGVRSVEPAGTFRRRCDVIDNLVLLAVSARPAAVMRHFCAYADAVTATQLDASRGALTLQCGLRVELRVVPGRCHGASLHHVTGSEAYEAEIRALGLKLGVRISDYGVFLLETGKAGARRVGGQKEEDVFTALGLPWIPPELRENRGEIEAARAGHLPRLVAAEEIRGDLRLRTRWGTGTATTEEMIRGCRAARYAYCAIADALGSAAPRGLGSRSLREQAEEIAALRRKYAALHILHGAEVAILPDGSLELDDDDGAVLDLVIAAVHTRARTSRVRATERLLHAIEDPRLDILAWPTGRLIRERDAVDADFDVVFQAAARRGVAVELAADPERLDPPAPLLRQAANAGVLIAVSTAAATPAQLDVMRFGVDQARRGWLEAGNVLNTRSWPELLHWLRRREHR
ncbi:MAG TPA: helix-hairpin-helix domain-containing protein [Longimicrobiales bacterium]|nr:helix-hairpin-helix domain-containing protein [Longimicrobiales bacterium]